MELNNGRIESAVLVSVEQVAYGRKYERVVTTGQTFYEISQLHLTFY